MKKNFVSSEQVGKARAVSLIDYLHQREPDNIVPSAPGEYKLKDHDSLKISNGKFHWFSRGIGGTNAIDFLVKVRGHKFQDAVRLLADGETDATRVVGKHSPSVAPKLASSGKREPYDAQDYVPFFELPTANSHNDDVIEYLKGRGIDESIINACINEKQLYQSAEYKKPLFQIVDGEKKPLYQDVDGKKTHRYEVIKGGCVFVGYDNQSQDNQNIPMYACIRGIKSDFKKDVAGSNKAFNFCMPPRIPQIASDLSNLQAHERLYVFEGATDCLSHASIAEIGKVNWDGYRLSLGGVSSLALHTFLENNPQIRNVYLCLDNDKPGKEATERISKELLANDSYSNINIYIAPPPDSVGMDFNDVLMFMREKMKEWSQNKEKDVDVSADMKMNVSADMKDAVGADAQEPQINKKRNYVAL